MKVTEICRSFSKTFQEKQFEPFSVFASYKAELDGSETEAERKTISQKLHILAQQDVRMITDLWEGKRDVNNRKKLEDEVPFP